MDAFSTFASTMAPVIDSTWTFIGDHWTWLSSTVVNGFTYTVSGSTGTVSPTSWTLTDFIQLIRYDTQGKMILKVVDDDMEQYMVWPDTTTFPKPGEWKGWCLSIVNGRNVPISCPE